MKKQIENNKVIHSSEELDQVFEQYVASVVESFGDPYDDRLPRAEGNPSLNEVAAEWGISPAKARQILISGGVYTTQLSREVLKLQKEGKSKEEIASILKLGKSTVYSYFPYVKRGYSKEEATAHALDTRRYRERKKVVEELEEHADTPQMERYFWNAVEAFEGYSFTLREGLRVRYIFSALGIRNESSETGHLKFSVERSILFHSFVEYLERSWDFQGETDTLEKRIMNAMFSKFGKSLVKDD